MALVERDPADKTLITHVGGAEITVRPERPVNPGRATVVLLRLVSPMLDTLAAAYLGAAEARALAHALLAAAETADGPAHGWRTPPAPVRGSSRLADPPGEWRSGASGR